MLSNSDVLDHHQTYNTTFPIEILNWYYNNDQDTIIVIWNKNNEIIYISRLIEDYLGTKVSEVVGKEWTECLPDEPTEEIKNHFELKQDKLHIPNIRIRSNQGKIYSFKGIVDRIKLKEEYFSICKLRNATYMNELKQVLLDSEKLILAGQLSAGLVHEIRNPLTSLKGFLQLVQAGVEQKEEYYKIMIGEIEKLEKITSELLHMAKPFKKSKQNESIDKMIKDVVFMMDTQLDMRDVEFKINVEKDLYLFCNASQIKQMLFNIVKNGAEAMNKSGIITIDAYKNSNDINIEITDNG